MFSIGADVEVFLKDGHGNDVISCDLFGGSKDNPVQFKDNIPGFMFQEDNTSLEFNIPVATSKGTFCNFIRKAYSLVGQLIESKGYVISRESVASYTEAMLSNPKTLIFGCEPDYNAWSKTENRKPNLVIPQERYAGGHIHVGTNKDMLTVVKNLDLFLGVPSVLVTKKTNRRKMYGKAGDMRPKPYGLEYRTLDNFWIFDKEYPKTIYDGVARAIQHPINKFTKIEEKAIRDTINNHDEAMAEILMRDYSVKPFIKKEEISFEDLLGISLEGQEL